MYELANLKTKKLPELQDIAKNIGLKGSAGLKKLDLIYQIVDFIASKPEDDEKQAPQYKEKLKPVNKADFEKKTMSKTLPVQKIRLLMKSKKNEICL